jgi:hypothetical protein
MGDGSDTVVQVAIVLWWQGQGGRTIVERNSITRKLPLVYVLLADVDAVLQAQGNHRLINHASKVCTTFYEE